MKKLGVGVYGTRGHQIDRVLLGHEKAELVATADFNIGRLTPEQQQMDIRHYETLDEMLKDDRVELVSLCSSIRANQAKDAVKCMKAGKHVYAEKPCAMTEEDLDLILRTQKETGCHFREMSGTSFTEPYNTIRNIVLSGQIGEVVQVFAQTSYNFQPKREQPENVEGGLIGWNGIYAVRFVEHIAGEKIKEIYALETNNGNPTETKQLNMAASMIARLENGGVASFVINYMGQSGYCKKNNYQVRIFGTKGFVEAVDGGTKTHLVIGENDLGAVEIKETRKDYLSMYIDEILGISKMPISLEDELHATRMCIRAKKSTEMFR